MDTEHLDTLIAATQRALDSATSGNADGVAANVKAAKQSYLELSDDLKATLRPALRALREADADAAARSLSQAEQKLAHTLSLLQAARGG